MIARQVLDSGRVQGVGFRGAVRRIAAGFEVTGWIKNLDDGRVEMQAMTADTEEMAEFLQAIDDYTFAALCERLRRYVVSIVW